MVPLTSSPIKSPNNGIAVHYIGGFVIRESSEPFVTNEKGIQDQLKCVICQKMDFSYRFFDRENKLCSIICSTNSNENKISNNNEPVTVRFKLKDFLFCIEKNLFYKDLR